MSPCHVSNEQCVAPAGIGVGGNGYAEGTVSARCECRMCGEPVCSKCSERVKLGDERVRICDNCLEDESPCAG